MNIHMTLMLSRSGGYGRVSAVKLTQMVNQYSGMYNLVCIVLHRIELHCIVLYCINSSFSKGTQFMQFVDALEQYLMLLS